MTLSQHRARRVPQWMPRKRCGDSAQGGAEPPTKLPQHWQAERVCGHRHGLYLCVSYHPGGWWMGSVQLRWCGSTGRAEVESPWEDVRLSDGWHMASFGVYNGDRTAAEAAYATNVEADRLRDWRAALAFVRAAPSLLRFTR